MTACYRVSLRNICALWAHLALALGCHHYPYSLRPLASGLDNNDNSVSLASRLDLFAFGWFRRDPHGLPAWSARSRVSFTDLGTDGNPADRGIEGAPMSKCGADSASFSVVGSRHSPRLRPCRDGRPDSRARQAGKPEVPPTSRIAPSSHACRRLTTCQGQRVRRSRTSATLGTRTPSVLHAVGVPRHIGQLIIHEPAGPAQPPPSRFETS